MSAMEAKFVKLFDSVGNFFTGRDHLPYSDRQQIVDENRFDIEQEVADNETNDSEEEKTSSIMKLSWALVHSKLPADVHRGIAMLQASVGDDSSSPMDKREKLYLLAVGYYRSGDCSRSRQIVEQCLEIAPDWSQALTLKKTIEDKIAKDGVIGIGIAATGVALIVGGIAAAVARKN